MNTIEEKPDIKSSLAPLVRYRTLIVMFCGAAVLTSLLLTYVVSEKYRATTTILYQPNEPVTFRPKTQDALGFPMPLVGLESIGSTLEDILKSDALLEQVVAELHLDQKRPVTGNWLRRSYQAAKDQFKEVRTDAWQLLKYGRVLPKNAFWDAVTGLRENVSLKRTPKAYTFELEVVDTDPERAAKIVDAISRDLASLVAATDTRAARDAQHKLGSHLEQTERDLMRIRAEIDAVKSGAHVASLDEELTLKLKNVSGFEQEMAAAENDLHSLNSERIAVKEELDSQPQAILYSSTKSDNPVVDKVRNELASLEVERAGLLESMTPNHPKVKALDARIAEARNKLLHEQPTQVSAESSGINEVRQKLLAKKFDIESQIAALSAKQRALAATVQAQYGQARYLSSNEGRLRAAQLELTAAEKNYELTNEAYEEARLAEANASTEVVVLNAAAVPRAPILPIKIYHVGATLLLSMFLGIGFAFLSDYFDPHMWRSNQVEALLGAPVLASIPSMANPHETFRQIFMPSLRERDRG